MKNKSLSWLLSLVSIMIAGFAIVSSCNKKFDEPPSFIEPNITVTTTIAQLKALHTVVGRPDLIEDDLVISGTVISSDSTGNIYQQLYIQDHTGGIQIRIQGSSLFTAYPLGRRVYVRTKGLTISDFAGLPQLGLGTGLIPTNLVDNYIIKGGIGTPIVPKVVNVADLRVGLQDSLLNTLITLQGYEFDAADLGKTYGDPNPATAGSRNFILKKCNGTSASNITLRNSSYANFATLTVPQGSGSITGIYTAFNTTKQFLIRDTSDIKFYSPRCSQGGGGSGPTTTVGINTLRANYFATSSPYTIPANTSIHGTIVSDTKNEAAGNYRIQDSTNSGIQFRVSSGNANWKLGDRVMVNVSGLTVELFQGDLQINNVSGASVTVVGTGTVTPRVTTAAQITANKDAWASTVVTINNVTITPGSTSTAGANYTLTDASGSIVTFIRTAVGFTPPANATSVTGYVSIFNGTPQLTLRTAADVVAGTSTNPTVTTTSVSGITQNSATTGGNVTDPGATAVTARGVVWSTTPNPDVSLSTKTIDGSGPGSFTSTITGLASNTTYYVRAYATNSAGTSYGNQIQFTTTGSGGGGTTPFSVTYDFGSVTTTSGTTDPTPVPTATGVTFGSFTSTVGTNSSGPGRFSFSGWPTGATHGSDVFSGTIDATKYFEVTITPASGKTMDLTRLTFTFQRSSTGVRQAVVRGSLDNFASNLPASINPANPELSVVATNVIQITDVVTNAQDGSTITFPASYSNLSTAVTIRFYGLNAEAAGGTFSIDNVTIIGATK